MKLRLRATRALVLPVAALAIVTHHTYPEDSLWDTAIGLSGLFLLLAATGGRIWANLHLSGKKNRTLVTEGPFSLTRNPLYFFSLLGFVGAGMAFESLALAALFTVAFFLSHVPTVRAEERRLEELFGEPYRRYCSQVPRFIPAFRRPRTGRTVEVDAVVFSRALRDCMAIPLVYLAAELLEWTKLVGLIPVFFHLP